MICRRSNSVPRRGSHGRYFFRMTKINLELADRIGPYSHNLIKRLSVFCQPGVTGGHDSEETHARKTFTSYGTWTHGSWRLSRLRPGFAKISSQQPIRLNVPFRRAQAPISLARLLSEELRQRWTQPVIVENKAGASGNIGTEAAARAAPDGQSLLVTVNTFVMNGSLYRALPYDPEKSFAPIAEIATGGGCLSRASFPQRQHAAGN